MYYGITACKVPFNVFLASIIIVPTEWTAFKWHADMQTNKFPENTSQLEVTYTVSNICLHQCSIIILIILAGGIRGIYSHMRQRTDIIHTYTIEVITSSLNYIIIYYLKWARSALRDLWLEVWGSSC